MKATRILALQTMVFAFFLGCVGLNGSSSYASGGASEAPPVAPTVDWASLPKTAVVRSKMGKKEHPVVARLISEETALTAGKTHRVGLHLTQQPQWHTYWKSPGSVGQATEIEWTLPEGYAVTAHQFPVPQRFEANGEVSFGYDKEVLLISELTVPESASGTLTIKATARWLVCKTTCIPGTADLQLTLPVAEKSEKTPWSGLFDHYEEQLPQQLTPSSGVEVTAIAHQSAVQAEKDFEIAFVVKSTTGSPLNIDASKAWPTFTPIAGGWDFMLNEQEPTRLFNMEDGSFVAVVRATAFEPAPEKKTDSVGGLFQLNIDGKPVVFEQMSTFNYQQEGVVTFSNDPVWAAYSEAKRAEPAAASAHPKEGKEPAAGAAEVEASVAPMRVAAPVTISELFFNIALGFIGGLILNIMPCVLPVLTLKLYSLVEQSDVTAKEQREAGLGYTAGILVSFWALALAVVVMRVVFQMEVDWGFQFQYPPYVAGLATLIFAFGLSLFGVFEIPAVGTGTAHEASSKEGVVGYFFTGVFATLLATPCSAPFLGSAIAYAFSAPTIVLFAIFSSIGFGLAFPFLFIAFIPALYRFMPQPGEWMETFKQFLGFTLVATTIWLVSVLLTQIGDGRATWFMVFLLFVAMGCWVFGRFGGVAESYKRQGLAFLAGMAVVGVGGFFFLDLQLKEVESCDNGELASDLDFNEHIPWQPFSEERLAKIDNKVVFVDFTADWCFSCKVNERTILESAAVRQAMAKHDVVPLKADWTVPDPKVTKWLHRFERAGVPMYLVIPADSSKEAILLPEVITSSMVIEALKRAK